MNREHDYDGVKDHQFRVLEHLNLLKISPLEDQKTLLRDRLRERGQSDPQIKEYVEKHGTPMPDQRQWKAQDTMLGKSPVHYKKLVNPYDKTQDITLRAKSYLHSNCASCHIEAGGGNAAMELEFQTPLEKMRIFDTPPVHQNFNLPDARLLAPGRPESSILLHRISQRDRNSMPPLSTNVVDVEAKQLMEQWIRSLAK